MGRKNKHAAGVKHLKQQEFSKKADSKSHTSRQKYIRQTVYGFILQPQYKSPYLIIVDLLKPQMGKKLRL